MNRFNLLNYIILIITGFFLFTIIFGVGFLWPKYQEIKVLKKNIEQNEIELRQEEQYFSNLSQIKRELEQYQEELSKIDSALPDSPSLPSFLNFIQETSSQSGLILKGMSPFTLSISEKNPDIREIRMSLTVGGSYSSFKDFLSFLEKSARIITVENISFSGEKEDTPFTFNLKIKTQSY